MKSLTKFLIVFGVSLLLPFGLSVRGVEPTKNYSIDRQYLQSIPQENYTSQNSSLEKTIY